MTHDELIDMGFEPIHLNNYELKFSVNYKFKIYIERKVVFVKTYKSYGGSKITLGSNFTPESLKQLIEILKKSQ